MPSNQSSITYYQTPNSISPNVIIRYPRLRRWEVAAPGGLQLGRRRRLHLLAGPVLARYRYQTRGATATEIHVLESSIYGSVVRH